MLPDWRMGRFYQQTYYWKELGLEGYQAHHRYCSLRGDDIAHDPLAWEATNKLMRLNTKTLHRIIDLIFKLARELFYMSWFPSRDAGPCDKRIRVQDLFVAIQQRFAAAKDSIELVLETSYKSIPESIDQLRIHEKIMRNYVDFHEGSAISPKGS